MASDWNALQDKIDRLEARKRRIERYVLIAWALLLVVLGVGTVMGQSAGPRIPGAERFYPDYRAAYADAVDCTKTAHPRPYEALIWMRVPGPNFRDPYATDEEGKLPNIGEWVSPDTIFVSAQWVGTWVPKHEMIHYLTRIVPNDPKLFGVACHAMWGYLPADTTRMGPGTTIRGPAYKDDQ